MAVQIINHMPDVEVHRGEPLKPLRALVPQPAKPPVFSRLTGRAWFAFGTFVVHVLAISGFMAAQRGAPPLAEADPIEVTLIETQARAAESLPEFRPTPQEISVEVPMPLDVTYEVESITPPPAAVSEAPTTLAGSIEPPVVEVVEYARAPSPVYPNESRRRHESGTVLLRVLVDERGRPADIRIERSSGFTRLDDAARTAVTRALFRPYEVNGVAQAAQVLIPIEFTRRS